MDSYSVIFVGDENSLDSLDCELSELKLVRRYKRGDTYFWSNGVTKKSVRGIPYCESSAEYELLEGDLTNLLSYLCEKKEKFDEMAIIDIQIWALLEREEGAEINGELSSNEISMLNRIKSSYCWSVILS